MTKIDIVSGFLGAGKTTLIKKLLAEAYKGEKLVLIEKTNLARSTLTAASWRGPASRSPRCPPAASAALWWATSTRL